MPGIVEFPQVVQEALQTYGDLFANEPQRRHFAEDRTGLVVAERTTVLGIHQALAQTTDQSCLNQFLTTVDWDREALNQRRLDSLPQDPDLRYSDHGIIPIANVLIDHAGQLIEDVGWFWDHAEQRTKIAHDYLFAHDVCSSGKPYPLFVRRFRKEQLCKDRAEAFRNHTKLAGDLIDAVCARHIPGTFTWDSSFSNAEIMNHTHAQRDRFGQPRAYVGDRKFNRKVAWKGTVPKIAERAASIAVADRKELRQGDERQWYFTTPLHIPGVTHKVRVVLLWERRHDAKPRQILVTHRLPWEVTRMVRVYRRCWTGTETFHRDGTQQLGMGDGQRRDGQGQTRHRHLVMVAYRLLMRQLRHGRAQEWALQRLMTIGEACRAMLRETLRTTLTGATEQVTQKSRELDHVIAELGQL